MPRLVKRLKLTSILDIEGPESPTERALISTGESMIARKGVDGVALNEIAYSAGQANKSAVQYYFKNLDGLINAIFRMRLRSEKKRRAQLLRLARDRDLLSNLRTLLEILYLSVAEQVDADRNHSYARFLMCFLAHPAYGYARHPSINPPADDPLHELLELLDPLTRLSRTSMIRRLTMESYTFYGYLLERDNALAAREPAPALTRVVDEALLGITASLLTPDEGR
ncbi:MAG: hypothetical protein OXC05_05130 [Halieaceae bacterium]|nr:hypothetical protein [Halieaceae bacterium]